ncbi:MAG: hypothetical protein ACYC1U_03195 [Candidatus Aquicultorales bacterium]
MKTRVTALVSTALVFSIVSSQALGAVSGLSPRATEEIVAVSKRQGAALSDALNGRWRPSGKSKDKAAVEKTARAFEKALGRGDAAAIWNKLIPKNSRGAVAVAMASDSRSGKLSIQHYRAVKRFEAARDVAFEAFRDGLAKKPVGTPVKRVDVQSAKDQAVALIRYADGGTLPIVLVKDRSGWKVDVATMMSVRKPNLAVSAVVAAESLLEQGLEENADALLRDASGLEGAFKRADGKLLATFFDSGVSRRFSEQLRQFKTMKNIINGLEPQT